MPEQAKKTAPAHSVQRIVLILTASLLAGALVIAIVGGVASLLVVRGNVRLGQLNAAALGALFLAGLAAGVLCRRKMGRRMPLVWSLCGAGTVSIVALICGGILYGMPEPNVLLTRLFVPLLGGVTAGVLSAMRK